MTFMISNLGYLIFGKETKFTVSIEGPIQQHSGYRMDVNLNCDIFQELEFCSVRMSLVSQVLRVSVDTRVLESAVS